jgi:serine/threonine protein kinase
MTTGMPEFWRLTVQAGLVPTDACEKIEQAFRSNHPDLELTPANVADFLVRYRRMTEFQAQCLLSSPPRAIRLGSFLIRTPETPPPLTKWVEVVRTSDQSLGFLIRTVAGNSVLQKHAAVIHPSLQPIEIEELGETSLVYSPLVGGRLLDPQVDDVSHVAVCRIGQQIADALGALHAQGIVHGQIARDRVWVMPAAGEVRLLRDCSGAAQMSDGWLDASLQPGVSARGNLEYPSTAASDVYAVGRLLFDLAEGQHLSKSSQTRSIISDHRVLPEVLQDAIRQGASGNPLYRVLGYAMAVDPAQRISDAATLSKALIASATALETRTAKPEILQPEKFQPEKFQAEKLQTEKLQAATVPAVVSKPIVAPSTSTVAVDRSLKTNSIPAAVVQTRPIQSAPVLVIRRRARPMAPMILAIMSLIVVGQITYLAVVDPGPRVVVRERPKLAPIGEIPSVRSTSQSLPAVPTKTVPPNNNLSKSTDDSKNPSASDGFQIVADSRLLFAPPNLESRTTGPPQVRLMPTGASILLVMRPSTWFGPTPDNFVSAMSDEWAPWAEAFQQKSGLDWNEIDSIAAGFYPGKEGDPKIAYSIRTRQPQPIESLVSKWQAEPKELAKDNAQASTARVYRSKTSTYVVIESAEEQTSDFFIGDTGQAQELIDGGNFESVEPGLPSILTRLWRQLPGDADLVVLMQPNFVFADGRQMIERSVPAFSESLQRILIPDVSAMSVSVHSSGDSYFVESRFLPAGRISEASLLRSMQEEISQWPQRCESFISSLAVDETWARLIKRYPAMVGFATGQSRFGISRSAVTINQYLPKSATAQIGIATLMAANAPPAQAEAVTSVSMTMDEILAFPISLSFVQESLKASMANVEDELTKSLPPGVTAPKIEIIGGDLEKNGITQNQQIRNFDMQSKPLREVLTAMVIAANPDKSAPAPTDVKQMLLWVVDTSSEPAKIRVTTREAATGVFELPTEFATPSPQK